MNTKTTLLLIIPLGLALLLAGCSKKKYETSVSGYVVEKNGSRKLAGAKVYLVEDHHGTFSTTQTYHDSTISGPDGHYSFKFNLGEGEFRAIAEYENYFPMDLPVDKSKRGLLKLGQSQSYNIELWAYAWFKLRFINVSGADGINVNRLPHGEYQGYQIWGEEDVTVVGLSRGNDSISLDYFIYPGGAHNRKLLYASGLDTAYYEITY